jgi:hypothetical protein
MLHSIAGLNVEQIGLVVHILSRTGNNDLAGIFITTVALLDTTLQLILKEMFSTRKHILYWSELSKSPTLEILMYRLNSVLFKALFNWNERDYVILETSDQMEQHVEMIRSDLDELSILLENISVAASQLKAIYLQLNFLDSRVVASTAAAEGSAARTQQRTNRLEASSKPVSFSSPLGRGDSSTIGAGGESGIGLDIGFGSTDSGDQVASPTCVASPSHQQQQQQQQHSLQLSLPSTIKEEDESDDHGDFGAENSKKSTAVKGISFDKPSAATHESQRHYGNQQQQEEDEEAAEETMVLQKKQNMSMVRHLALRNLESCLLIMSRCFCQYVPHLVVAFADDSLHALGKVQPSSSNSSSSHGTGASASVAAGLEFGILGTSLGFHKTDGGGEDEEDLDVFGSPCGERRREDGSRTPGTGRSRGTAGRNRSVSDTGPCAHRHLLGVFNYSGKSSRLSIEEVKHLYTTVESFVDRVREIRAKKVI